MTEEEKQKREKVHELVSNILEKHDHLRVDGSEMPESEAQYHALRDKGKAYMEGLRDDRLELVATEDYSREICDRVEATLETEKTATKGFLNEMLRYRMEASKREVDLMRDKAKSILESHGIYILVHGCGCCGSPEFRMDYKGETIMDTTNVNIDMFPEDRI